MKKKFFSINKAVRIGTGCIICALALSFTTGCHKKAGATGTIEYSKVMGLAEGTADFKSMNSPDINIKEIQSYVGQEIDYSSGIDVQNIDNIDDFQMWVDATKVDIYTVGRYTATYQFVVGEKTFEKTVGVTVKEKEEGGDSLDNSQNAGDTSLENNGGAVIGDVSGENGGGDLNGNNENGGDNSNGGSSNGNNGNDGGNNGNSSNGNSGGDSNNSSPNGNSSNESGGNDSIGNNGGGNGNSSSNNNPNGGSSNGNDSNNGNNGGNGNSSSNNNPNGGSSNGNSGNNGGNGNSSSNNNPNGGSSNGNDGNNGNGGSGENGGGNSGNSSSGDGSYDETREIITSSHSQSATKKPSTIGYTNIELLSGKYVKLKCTNARYIVSTRTDESQTVKNDKTYNVSKLVITFNTGEERVLETVEKAVS